MNHSKSINNRTNSLHEWALRLIYCDHSSNFQDLLQRYNSVTMHQKNIQALVILMYKVTNNIAPTIVSELFSFSNINYNLRSGSQLHQPSVNTIRNDLETITYFGIWYPQKWNKNHLYLLSKEKLRNGSQKTARIESAKWTYRV